MLNVNICVKWQLAVMFMTKVIHVTRYQSVDTLTNNNTHTGIRIFTAGCYGFKSLRADSSQK